MAVFSPTILPWRKFEKELVGSRMNWVDREPILITEQVKSRSPHGDEMET